MCKWGTTETVHCPAGFNGRNRERQLVPVDACIADLVRALNDSGIHTLDSCCGHGRGDGMIRLVDGRVLRVESERPEAVLE